MEYPLENWDEESINNGSFESAPGYLMKDLLTEMDGMDKKIDRGTTTC